MYLRFSGSMSRGYRQFKYCTSEYCRILVAVRVGSITSTWRPSSCNLPIRSDTIISCSSARPTGLPTFIASFPAASACACFRSWRRMSSRISVSAALDLASSNTFFARSNSDKALGTMLSSLYPSTPSCPANVSSCSSHSFLDLNALCSASTFCWCRSSNSASSSPSDLTLASTTACFSMNFSWAAAARAARSSSVTFVSHPSRIFFVDLAVTSEIRTMRGSPALRSSSSTTSSCSLNIAR
mmetsp:Transcript_39849/g.71364  ORF Transcript_39849/g.71364 Transcript_39849/m.71364 type:complete len:241 (-) Transcript_39849:323-1045(-)